MSVCETITLECALNLTSTDVEGFKYALLGHGISKVENCLIMGAGATARAAVAAVSELAENISVLNRNPERVATDKYWGF